jgi:hypothetical protein
MNQDRRIAIASLIVGIFACIGTYLVIPEVRVAIAWVSKSFVALLPSDTKDAPISPTPTQKRTQTRAEPAVGFVPSATAPIPTYPPTATQSLPQCKGWNLASDFRLYPNQENPNRDSCGNLGVWHFMRSAGSIRKPQTYSLLPNFVSNAFGVLGFEQWQGTHDWPNVPNIRLPSIGINTTAEIWLMETALHPANAIVAHPWQTEELVVIGWRSPLNGYVAVSGEVIDVDSNGGDGILWYIDKDSANLASGEYNDGGRQLFRAGKGGNNLANVPMRQGEFIYFVIHPKGNDMYDTTRIDIRIDLMQ